HYERIRSHVARIEVAAGGNPDADGLEVAGAHDSSSHAVLGPVELLPLRDGVPSHARPIAHRDVDGQCRRLDPGQRIDGADHLIEEWQPGARLQESRRIYLD